MAKNGGTIAIVAFLLIGWGIIDLTSDSTQEQEATQCNDGIDNDQDGEVDSNSIDGNVPADSDCQFIVFNGGNAQNYQCLTWNDEANGPATLEECGY